MDKETLEKLISDQPKDIRAKGVLLFNGAADTAAAYQKAPTAANLRDWEAAQAALGKFEEQLNAKGSAEKPFATLIDVLEFLKIEGWKETKTSLYRRQKEGKLLPGPDGSYQIKDVEKYARTWLKQKSTGKRVDERMDELQRKKLEMDLAGQEIENRRKQLSLDRDLGRFIRIEEMEIELATRAGILDAGLKHWLKSHAAEWIRLVDGNMQKIAELVTHMSRELDEHIDTYASPNEYDVSVDGEKEEGYLLDEAETEIEAELIAEEAVS